jgi:hypothetical protein
MPYIYLYFYIYIYLYYIVYIIVYILLYYIIYIIMSFILYLYYLYMYIFLYLYLFICILLCSVMARIFGIWHYKARHIINCIFVSACIICNLRLIDYITFLSENLMERDYTRKLDVEGEQY